MYYIKLLLLIIILISCYAYRHSKENFCKKAPLRRVLKYFSSIPSDTPVSMAFDGLLMKELGQRKLPSLDLEQNSTKCSEKLTDTQIRRYLVSALGAEAHLPAVGINVTVEIPCIHVHDCRGLGGSTLMFVEFVAIRSGDTVGIHYECQIMVDPLALIWFRRRGELPSHDVYSCT